MKIPRLLFHVIEDPHVMPALPGYRGEVASEISERALGGRAMPVMASRRAQLLDAVAETEMLLNRVAAEYARPRYSTEWDELDIFVFQSTLDHPDPPKVRGVMGFYNDGPEGPLKFAPYMDLYVLPGAEDRLSASALHEFGHFLRSRAAWQLESKAFVYRVFEEGLSEHLVGLTLGPEHVIHSAPLSGPELEMLLQQVTLSRRDVLEKDSQPEKSLQSYQLGYHVVQRLLNAGEVLADLVKLPLPETGSLVQLHTKALLELQA
ncbi:hypothetical protein [Deinococcus multiflagellatus]|uniref:Uncharacterized protein n=1 Tax=Deinococcus multiflagellatus TaxID=1656887 RepID=A0ABW1ZSL0_9DEIO|nr:hypothetical protein [Deinococcus multiflagellatus]MBZ9715813.1 hypothetical protein [Deinococcus multiflagellatus]